MFLKSCRKKFTFAISALILVAMFACDGVQNAFLDARETTPPTFSTTGNKWLLGMQVQAFPSGMTPTQIGRTQGETIWKIAAPKKTWATDFPLITYGRIPDGWAQTIPITGRPPALTEGRVYEATPFDSTGPLGSSFFAIRAGKTVNVTGELKFSNQ
jgi:hypothetical protein